VQVSRHPPPLLVNRDLATQPGAFGNRNRLGRDRRGAFDLAVAERPVFPRGDGERFPVPEQRTAGTRRTFR
jgi:hypothetical protein